MAWHTFYFFIDIFDIDHFDLLKTVVSTHFYHRPQGLSTEPSNFKFDLPKSPPPGLPPLRLTPCRGRSPLVCTFA